MTAKDSIQFTAPVKDQELPLGVRKKIGQVIKQFDGKNVTISITEAKKQRSDRQNAFYYGVVLPIVVEMFREAGSEASREEIHICMKKLGGLTASVRMPDGTYQEVVTSSTAQSAPSWEIWMDKIRVWAAEYGTEIPLPNEHFPKK